MGSLVHATGPLKNLRRWTDVHNQSHRPTSSFKLLWILKWAWVSLGGIKVSNLKSSSFKNNSNSKPHFKQKKMSIDALAKSQSLGNRVVHSGMQYLKSMVLWNCWIFWPAVMIFVYRTLYNLKFIPNHCTKKAKGWRIDHIWKKIEKEKTRKCIHWKSFKNIQKVLIFFWTLWIKNIFIFCAVVSYEYQIIKMFGTQKPSLQVKIENI